jgi:hypothetical protein
MLFVQRKYYFPIFGISTGGPEGLAHASPSLTVLPQNPHCTPSLFNQGLCEAQVPRNSPFFKKINRTDIKAKKSTKTPSVSRKTVMIIAIYET